MGALKRLNRWRKEEAAKVRATALSKELQQFYGTHLVSKWQRDKVGEIRAMYEQKQRGLDRAHDIASSQLSEEYMEFELHYLHASDRFREKNPGKEWHPKGVQAMFYKSFWKELTSPVATLMRSVYSHAEVSE